MRIKGKALKATLLWLIAGMLGACASSTPVAQTGPAAEMTYDGLVRMDNTRMDKVWVRPGVDLNSYDKVQPVIAEIQYATVKSDSRNISRLTGQTNFPMSDKEKQRFASAVNEVFMAEFAKSKKFQVTDQPGKDVLLLKVELLDVASRVPPQDMVPEHIFLNRIADAGLVLELYDSQSKQILARATDRREFSYPGDRLRLSSPGMNEAEVKRGLETWADLIVDGLDSLKTR